MKRIWRTIKWLTRHPDESRPRALIRLGLQTAVMTATLIFGAIPILLWAHKSGRLTRQQMLTQDLDLLYTRDLASLSISVLFQSLAMIASVLIVARWVDRRRVGDLGLAGGARFLRDFGSGALLGLALMAGIFGVQSAAGWTRVVGALSVSPGNPGFPFVIADMLIVFLLVALSEELLARGYWIKNLSEGLARLPRLAGAQVVILVWIATAVVFGLGHATNPNATLTGVVGTGMAGLLLGLPFILTGELGFSVGLHFAWNFAQGCVFGFPVSGVPAQGAFIQTVTAGPEVWTGGQFGPEAGLTGIIAILVGAAAILGYTRWTRGELAVAESLLTPNLRPRKQKRKVAEPESDA